MATGAEFQTVEIGYMGATDLVPVGELHAGEVGYIAGFIKDIGDTRVGDNADKCGGPAPLRHSLDIRK